ncbi:hypothetical protein AWZ03_002274 [Drosophila navojoa]|uniref:Uncharacterized protein n=1 Tax=Drosophila navojoa TaxID=7232 RepID=A0A484BQY1_DRONA|nr:uncharacterized protein LOC108650312 [Drosophila navojoa]TDG51187.1 hypothetical protein AWZ03_002274 [Drosophila navojoa]
MSFNNKDKQKYCEEIDDDNDSFHSFAQSDFDSVILESLTDIENSTTTDSPKYEKNAVKKDSTQAYMKRSFQAAYSTPKSSDSCILDANAPFESPIQYQTPELQPSRESLKKSHYMVEGNSEIPDMNLFNMNATPSNKNDPMNVSIDTEVLQKYAFTEIWLEEQQNNPGKKRSLHREFTAALDNYFHKDKTVNKLKSMTDEEEFDRKKGNLNTQVVIKPSELTTPTSASFQTVSESTPYVSPFEDMPTVHEDMILTGPNAYITVPAGFDLTNLVEYKNPNHWHRRPTTRNDYHP